MTTLPDNPHAIIEVADATGGNRRVWDSWSQVRTIQSVRVDLPTNESAAAEIAVFDPDFKFIDNVATATGVPRLIARVWLGYGERLGGSVFKGLLARVERGPATTIFTAYDTGLKMKLEKKPGYHGKKTDVAILRDLAARNGLRFQGPGAWPADGKPSSTQDEQTDWEFALEVARDAGLLLFVRHDTLFAVPPAKVGAPALTLENRKDFHLAADWSFAYKTPENQEGRPRKVTRRGRGRGGKRLDGESETSGKVGDRKRIVLRRDTPGKHTKATLSARARAQKELEREHAFEAHLRAFWPVSGRRADVRDTVRVAGVGRLFGGDYLVDRAAYDFAPGKLEMSLDLYRDTTI
jgi:hypothetical protein